MPMLSVKIPTKLSKSLAEKANEMEITTSALVRKFLDFSIEHFDTAAQKPNKNSWQKKLATYNLMTYHLLEKFVSEEVEDGESLIGSATEEAEKVASKILK